MNAYRIPGTSDLLVPSRGVASDGTILDGYELARAGESEALAWEKFKPKHLPDEMLKLARDTYRARGLTPPDSLRP